MQRIINLNQSSRQLLFETTSRDMKVASVVIEKDFWVCVVLNYLMNESKYKDYFIFKGGTSLSKCYNVIKRFSEDVDLIIKWDKIGFEDDEVYRRRSISQDSKFEALMNQKGADFIQQELKKDLVDHLAAEINGLSIESDPEDPMTLFVYYPTSYASNYIKPAIKIEMGPVAAKTPTTNASIEPYCYRSFTAENKQAINVRIITIARTFFEKLLILYAECNRPTEKKTPARYSRHYYDVYMIYKSDYFENILKQKELFEEVKLFKSKYYRNAWSKLENCSLKNIKLVPSNDRLESLYDDYKMMEDMMFGLFPSFGEIVTGLKELENVFKKEA